MDNKITFPNRFQKGFLKTLNLILIKEKLEVKRKENESNNCLAIGLFHCQRRASTLRTRDSVLSVLSVFAVGSHSAG